MVVRADHVSGPPQGCWTYEDYAALPDDGNRYEIIDGVLYLMPSPAERHQAASVNFTFELVSYLRQTGLGRLFHAPFDVELPLTPTVTVQPDIVVVLHANQGIITRSRIRGVPDLVIEILSPGTMGYDRRVKQDAYARAGVPEVWFADPANTTVELLALEDGACRSLGVFTGTARLPSRVLPDLPTPVDRFFI